MDPFQFIVERYNYWIFIVLMMIGLYTVIARGNLVKKIIGLNIFQTSVFIYYISIGKIAGGTAPIYLPGDMYRRMDHGEGHGGDGHGGDDHGGDGHGAEEVHGVEHGEEKSHGDAEALHAGDANASNALYAGGGEEAGHAPAADLHGGAANVASGEADHGGATQGGDAHGADAYGAAADFVEPIYSNPLPHVLILTAIVVGIATTAVGLALAVRIREAYGTIEEDELEDADNIAEFGVADPRERADAQSAPAGGGQAPQVSGTRGRGAKLAGDRLGERLGRGAGSENGGGAA